MGSDCNSAARRVTVAASDASEALRGRILSCYVYRQNSGWGGICTDFDIAVDGRSRKRVERSLGICLEMFLADVLDLSADDREHLLGRKSPLWLRARLVCMSVLQRVRVGTTRRVLLPVSVCRGTA